ncbi:MAG: SRPBCC domain-containing protein [bacterium]
MPSGEVTVTAIVPLAIDDAFIAFRDDIDRWWGAGRSGATVIRFEGDRLIEASTTGAETLASVSSWEQPTRIEMAWNGPHSEPGDSVVVEFAQEPTGTRVTVRHFRIGVEPAAVTSAIIGLWWGDLLSRFQQH